MIIGSKIILQDKRLVDAQDDYAWQTDPELAKLDAISPLDVTFSQYLSDYTGELQYLNRTRLRFAIETLDGKHIGNCSCYNINRIKLY